MKCLRTVGHPRRLDPEDGKKRLCIAAILRTFVWRLVVGALILQAPSAFAWIDGELLIWMDNERGRAVQALGEQFQRELGITVTVETPQRITDSFPIAAQAGKGPDIVIWAHDKVADRRRRATEWREEHELRKREQETFWRLIRRHME